MAKLFNVKDLYIARVIRIDQKDANSIRGTFLTYGVFNKSVDEKTNKIVWLNVLTGDAIYTVDENTQIGDIVLKKSSINNLCDLFSSNPKLADKCLDENGVCKLIELLNEKFNKKNAIKTNPENELGTN